MKIVKRMLLVFLAIAMMAVVLAGPIMSDVEHAKYDVVQAEGAFELRDYAPMIVAEVQVEGARKEAIGAGFRQIADYIFGNNIAAQNVAMTAPVIQQPSEQVAMTAPVTQQGDGNSWTVRFVMPSQYTLQTLPKPNNVAVQLKEVEGKRFAVVRFAGRGNDRNLQKHEAKLKQILQEKGLKAKGVATYAFFNPPWTLPFLRRNEVMIEVEK